MPTSLQVTRNACTHRMCELCAHIHISHTSDVGNSLEWGANVCPGGLFWMTYHPTVLLSKALCRFPHCLAPGPSHPPQAVFYRSFLESFRYSTAPITENKNQVVGTQCSRIPSVAQECARFTSWWFQVFPWLNLAPASCLTFEIMRVRAWCALVWFLSLKASSSVTLMVPSKIYLHISHWPAIPPPSLSILDSLLNWTPK